MTNLGEGLPRAGAEGLAELRRVDRSDPDLYLLLRNKDGDGIAVVDCDDLALKPEDGEGD